MARMKVRGPLKGVLSLLPCGSQGSNRVTWLRSRCLYPLRYLASPFKEKAGAFRGGGPSWQEGGRAEQLQSEDHSRDSM